MEIKIVAGRLHVDGEDVAFVDWGTKEFEFPAKMGPGYTEEIPVTDHYGDETWVVPGEYITVHRAEVVAPRRRVPIPPEHYPKDFGGVGVLVGVVDQNRGYNRIYVALGQDREPVAVFSNAWQCWRTPRKDLWAVFDRRSFRKENVWKDAATMAAQQGLRLVD